MTKRQSAKYKIDRRMGENIWGRPKSPVNKREYGPGQHGQRRKGKASDFGIQLKAKQKLKGYYGNLTEKQFSRTYTEAARRKGNTAENLISLLEARLDAVVYRAKFVPTVFAARQFVNHGHVLVNGKRRHTTGNLAVLSGVYQGAAAADLGFIPMAGIGRIEVLTDGAAAQYGTDAIAGVVNIILKKNPSGGSISATGGEYFDGGGKTAGGSINIGMAPTENSYLNLTVESKYHGFSNRGLPDQRVFNPASPSYSAANNAVESQIPGYPNLNLISGDAEYRLNNLVYNAGIELPADFEVYSFGTLGHKDASAYENYRRYNRIQGKMGAADRPFPLGFSPRERIIEDDYAMTLGVSGKLAGWDLDVSSTYGKDDIEVRVEDSANASLYADTSTLTAKGFTPTSFHAGSCTERARAFLLITTASISSRMR